MLTTSALFEGSIALAERTKKTSCQGQKTSSSLKPYGDKETNQRRQRAERLVTSNQNITDVEWLQSLDDDIAWIEGDPIEEISQRLDQSRQAGQKIKDLHIVAHGINSELKLGNTLVTKQYLKKYSQHLQSWKLDSIYLWCCNLGNNANLLSTLESLTGAEVFASKNIIEQNNTRIDSNKGNTAYLEQIICPREIGTWKGNLMSPANHYVTVENGHSTGSQPASYFSFGAEDEGTGDGVALLQSMPWWGDAALAQQWANNSHYESPNLNLDGDIGGNVEEVAFVYALGTRRSSGVTTWSSKRLADDWGSDDVTRYWSGGFAVAKTTLSGITINQTGTSDGSGNLLTTEAGGSSTFTVVLDSQPTGGNVTISLSGVSTDSGLVAREYSLSTSTLTFTNANWDTTQSVTVTGGDDDYEDGDRTYTLVATASNTGGYAGTERAVTNVKNTDNDTNGITIAQTGTTDGSGNLITTEAGGTSTFTVVLDAKPSGNVTVSLSGNDATENTLSASSLTFTTSNWNTAQTVTVTGINDSTVDGDITTTLTATASNSGNYAGTESDTTTVKNTDNDTNGITIAQTGTNDGSGNLLTTEAGGSSTFTVVLDAKPSSNVTVSLSGNNDTENTLSTSSLTFTDTNWNTPQTVTITGVNDDIDDGNITTTLTATASNTGGYAGSETSTVTIKNTDDDTNGITIAQTGTNDGSGNLLTTEAGGSSSFTVVLDAEPTSNVTVSTTGNDATENSLSADSLTFTSSNWNSAQTITVTGVDDDIVDGDITTTLAVTANNAGGYAGTESATTTVKNTDDDSDGGSSSSSSSSSSSGNNNTDQTPSSLSELISNNNGTGFRVTGTSGVWVQMQVLKANADLQNSLQIVNSEGHAIGSVGATKNSTNMGNNEFFLSGGSEIRFHQSSNRKKLNQSPDLKINPELDNSFMLHLEDSKNQDADYNDLSIKITTSQQPKSINAFKLSSQQNHINDPILNLTDLNAGTTKLRLTLQSDCSNTNRVAFVKLDADQINGFTIDGIASTAGSTFEESVRDNLINPGDTEILMTGEKTREIEWTFNQIDEGFFAPVFINQETGKLATYGITFSGAKHNSIKTLGSNFFGYEDTLSAEDSDWDFNDITMMVEMI